MEFVLGLALSAHIGFNGEYNNAHPYFDIRNEKVIMGGYYNSEENVSLYFGRSTEIFKGLELETAIVSGYDMPIVPWNGGVESPRARSFVKDAHRAPHRAM